MLLRPTCLTFSGSEQELQDIMLYYSSQGFYDVVMFMPFKAEKAMGNGYRQPSLPQIQLTTVKPFGRS